MINEFIALLVINQNVVNINTGNLDLNKNLYCYADTIKIGKEASKNFYLKAGWEHVVDEPTRDIFRKKLTNVISNVDINYSLIEKVF